MIEIFSGKLRNGKTYAAVERMAKALAAGQTIYTNVDLVWDACRDLAGSTYGVDIQREQYNVLTPEMISRVDQNIKWGTPDCPVMVVIDEVHLWFNARDYKNASRPLLNFLTQSGKAAVDFIFISQHPENIDAQIRRQTQYYCRFRDMQKLHMAGLACKWPFPQFMQLIYDEDGRTLTDRKLIWKNRKIFACYKTLAFLNGGDTTERLLRTKLSRVSRLQKFKAWWRMNKAAAATIKVKHTQ